jgi:Phosphotransferase enzyme family
MPDKHPFPGAVVGDLLRQCAQEGSVEPLRGTFAPAAVLDAYLPGKRIACSGESEILAEMATWWPDPAEVVFFEQDAGAGGTTVSLERHPQGRELADRRLLMIHVDGDRVSRLVVFSDRPRLVPAANLTPLPIEGIVDRKPLAVSGAYSGNLLEEVETRLGRFVVKHISRAEDWIMRATDDEGREVALWRDGVFDELAPGIDVPIIDAVPSAKGWSVVMRNVAEDLVQPGVKLSRPQVRQLFAAARTMHDAFRGRVPSGVCTLEDRLRLFSAATASREIATADLAPKLDQRVWEVVADVAPSDIVDVVLRIQSDPSLLTAELAKCDRTLLHGDLKPANFGVHPDRVVLLDWQLAAEGPPAIDFIWTLNFVHRFDATLDELLDDIRAVAGAEHDERALQLAIIFHMAMAAIGLVADIADDPDEEVRTAVADEFGWWVSATRRALDTTWAPTTVSTD